MRWKALLTYFIQCLNMHTKIIILTSCLVVEVITDRVYFSFGGLWFSIERVNILIALPISRAASRRHVRTHKSKLMEMLDLRNENTSWRVGVGLAINPYWPLLTCVIVLKWRDYAVLSLNRAYWKVGENVFRTQSTRLTWRPTVAPS